MGLDNLKGLFSDSMPLRGGFGHGRKDKSNRSEELQAKLDEAKGVRGTQEDPNVFTKSELESLRAKISRFGAKLPAGLDRVISEFDKVDTDADGKVTKTELHSYAAANGFKLPKLGSREALQKVISQPDAAATFFDRRGQNNEDAVDLSKFTPGLGIQMALANTNAASMMLRNYTAKGTVDDSDATPETGILPVLTDTKA